MHSIPAKRRKSGFTLIELLVVIAIIAILAAILFPVFARARENARRASCQSNEKNIALGFKQYIQDNGEKYPPEIQGTTALKTHPGLSEYIKSEAIFFCPSDSNKTKGSYGYNNDIAAMNESAIDNLPASSSGTVLLGENNVTRHFAGQNRAFVDGHVKWAKDSTLYDGGEQALANSPGSLPPTVSIAVIYNVGPTGDHGTGSACTKGSGACVTGSATQDRLAFRIWNSAAATTPISASASCNGGAAQSYSPIAPGGTYDGTSDKYIPYTAASGVEFKCSITGTHNGTPFIRNFWFTQG